MCTCSFNLILVWLCVYRKKATHSILEGLKEHCLEPSLMCLLTTWEGVLLEGLKKDEQRIEDADSVWQHQEHVCTCLHSNTSKAIYIAL